MAILKFETFRAKRIIFFFLTIYCFLMCQTTFGEDIYFICNKSVPVDTLSKNDIKNIFLGKKTTWEDQKEITFVVLQLEKAYNTFLRNYLRRNKQQYKLYWRHMVFTGEGFLPKTFQSEDRILKFVAETDGAIGYLSHKTDNGAVKILSISN